METPLRALVMSAIVVLGTPALSLAGGDDAPVTVFIRNLADVPRSALDAGQLEAARIGRRAGLRIVWRTDSDETDSTDIVQIRLVVQRRLLGGLTRPSQFQMGAAPETGADCRGVAYLFFDQIVGFSGQRRADPALVLGTVAAHEIGHILLGVRDHAPEGLMRADWSADDMLRAAAGTLIFSPKESATMRATVARCAAESTLGGPSR